MSESLQVREGAVREREWLAATLEITLRAALCLCDSASREPCPSLARILGDVADHAALWARRLSEHDERAPGPRLHEPLEAVALVARAAAGLRERFDEASGLGPESRRLVVSCAADLDAHRAWSAVRLRRAERGGRGPALAAVRARLPSRAEFRLDRSSAARSA
jgi:hypothetical protein